MNRMSGSPGDEEVAAGGLILNIDSSLDAREPSVKVLVIHRPKYDDWSFPKGKLNQGEPIDRAAIREVLEETGLQCRIIRPLAVRRYNYRRRKTDVRLKAVHYFLMEPITKTLGVDGFEVDQAEWLSPGDAAGRLTYRIDRETLDALVEEGLR